MLVSGRVSQDIVWLSSRYTKWHNRNQMRLSSFTRFNKYAQCLWRSKKGSRTWPSRQKSIDMVSCSGHVLNVTNATDIPFERCRIEQLRNLNSCFFGAQMPSYQTLAKNSLCASKQAHQSEYRKRYALKLFENARVNNSKISLHKIIYSAYLLNSRKVPPSMVLVFVCFCTTKMGAKAVSGMARLWQDVLGLWLHAPPDLPYGKGGASSANYPNLGAS